MSHQLNGGVKILAPESVIFFLTQDDEIGWLRMNYTSVKAQSSDLDVPYLSA